MGILDLPNEMIAHIFSMLPTQELLGNVAQVGSRFHQLAFDPSAHLHVNISAIANNRQQPDLYVEQLKEFLQRATRHVSYFSINHQY